MIRYLSLIMLLFCLSVAESHAHPMGNFSINHYSGLEIGEEEIRVRYILDFAEIPAFQEIQEIDLDQNGDLSAAEREHYLSRKGEVLAAGLELTVGETPHRLIPLSSELTFPPGAGNLPTMRLSVLYGVQTGVAAKKPVGLVYRDENYVGRAGWKEMTAAGRDGISLIGSSLPTTGSELRAYPEKEVTNPPQVSEARFAFSLGDVRSAASATPHGVAPEEARSNRNDRFTALLNGITPTGSALVTALLISFGLGMFHALSPGHGKTMVAAYLVGSRGTARHALFLGLIVTLSHTVGVFLLGIVTLYLSKYIVPERLYPWLGLLSGLSIVIIGFSLLRQRWQGIRHSHADHPHHAHHTYSHHDHGHPHGHNHSHAPTFSGLLGLGISGGIIPCPSALVVLLSAIAFHQVVFGLILIIAFSAGLAATLVMIGLAMVYLGEKLGRFGRFGLLGRVVPVLSAAGVTVLGGMIALGAWLR